MGFAKAVSHQDGHDGVCFVSPSDSLPSFYLE